MKCPSFLIPALCNTGGPASAVSWYHIFVSLNQYYTSLRREVPSSQDMHISVGPQGPHHRGITPQELEGLVCVLKLCRVVSENVSILLVLGIILMILKLFKKFYMCFFIFDETSFQKAFWALISDK